MTLHTNRGTRAIKFECDVCSDIFDPETTDFSDAVVDLVLAGWRYKRINGVNRHLCDHASCKWDDVK